MGFVGGEDRLQAGLHYWLHFTGQQTNTETVNNVPKLVQHERLVEKWVGREMNDGLGVGNC